jgi:hypothetical protein
MSFRAIMQAGVAGVACWPHDEEANRLGKERMIKERIVKEDGRYLIYYRFVEEKRIRESGNQGSGNQGKPDSPIPQSPASPPPEVRHV